MLLCCCVAVLLCCCVDCVATSRLLFFSQNDLADEMEEREEQLSVASRNRGALQTELQDVLRHIAQEAGDMRTLESELREGDVITATFCLITDTISSLCDVTGQISRNDELRDELQHIVSGLQSYLSDVEVRAQQQRSDVERMTQERDDLLRHLQEMEVDREFVEQQEVELKTLQEVCAHSTCSVANLEF